MSTEAVVIDSSVLVAIFKGESDSVHLAERLMPYSRKVMSAATWLESAMVCEGGSRRADATDLAEIVAELGIEIVPFTFEQAGIAFEAFKRFGKGRGVKASLNLGDCFVYALAKELGASLLFKGSDFAHTDVTAA